MVAHSHVAIHVCGIHLVYVTARPTADSASWDVTFIV
jgi:hypothetical protein